MKQTNEFDDIRPYYDNEIQPAMRRIAQSGSFPLLSSFLYPDEPLNDVRQRVEGYTNIRDFQHEVMAQMNRRVIEESITEFSVSGLERLSPRGAYLYVSNHRDIVLDSSLLQYYLVSNGFETTQITFGANLMMNPLVTDIGKSNKMFRVERPGGSAKEFYQRSLHLSQYLRYVLTELHESAWIAQRNGRTKDGKDHTDQGIIKMFCMSLRDDKIRAIRDLHIVPVSVSYEWESCDILKTLELYQRQFGPYTKKPGEDLTSVLVGILHPKGRVHFELCRPLAVEELNALSHLTSNDYHRAVARLIDQRILNAYRLWPTNYVAHDMRYGSKQFEDEYTPELRRQFEQRLHMLERYDTCDVEQLKDIFLGIYANPVESKLYGL